PTNSPALLMRWFASPKAASSANSISSAGTIAPPKPPNKTPAPKNRASATSHSIPPNKSSNSSDQYHLFQPAPGYPNLSQPQTPPPSLRAWSSASMRNVRLARPGHDRISSYACAPSASTRNNGSRNTPAFLPTSLPPSSPTT